jgi:hypothetical protein
MSEGLIDHWRKPTITRQCVVIRQRHNDVFHETHTPRLLHVSHVGRPAPVRVLQFQESCHGRFRSIQLLSFTGIGIELAHHV